MVSLEHAAALTETAIAPKTIAARSSRTRGRGAGASGGMTAPQKGQGSEPGRTCRVHDEQRTSAMEGVYTSAAAATRGIQASGYGHSWARFSALRAAMASARQNLPSTHEDSQRVSSSGVSRGLRRQSFGRGLRASERNPCGLFSQHNRRGMEGHRRRHRRAPYPRGRRQGPRSHGGGDRDSFQQVFGLATIAFALRAPQKTFEKSQVDVNQDVRRPLPYRRVR